MKNLSQICLLLLSLFAAMSTAPAGAQNCGFNFPAFPVPECRDSFSGEEVDCEDSGAVRLWPEGLRPARPGQQLPARRDSTDYVENTIPGAASGHELFLALDIVGDHVYMAYNAGIQVWNVAGVHAEDPQRILARDGWFGQFLHYPPPGESDGFTDHLAALDPAGSGHDVLIAVSGRDGSGVNFWEHTLSPSRLEPLYQDLGDRSTQVALAELNGTVYGFAANFDGVYVYDVSHARALADVLSPCLDDAGSVCPGIYLGELADMEGGGYVAVTERAGRLYVAASDGRGLISQSFRFEIWESADPSLPGAAVRKYSGLSSNVRGLEFFVLGGTYYLSLLDLVEDEQFALKIFDVDHCLDEDGCESLGTPVWQQPISPTSAGFHQTTFSESEGTPYLYFGFASVTSGGAQEQLLDLSLLGSGQPLREATAGAGSYLDICNGLSVDYWGDYYSANDHGLGNASPRMGMFRGRYFYRAAVGLFDVHVRNPSVGGAVFADGFESGDTSAWEPPPPTPPDLAIDKSD